MKNSSPQELGALMSRLKDWYKSECNGDWEHTYGVKIGNIDNPGWMLTVDLWDTNWARLKVPRKIYRASDDDWFQGEVTKSQFIGCGSVDNLANVIRTFFEMVVDNKAESPKEPAVKPPILGLWKNSEDSSELN